MKYLYPYECEKLKLSNPSELQAAIDGNRREGRRSSYGYDMSPGPTLVPPTHPLNGGLMNGKMGRTSPSEYYLTNTCDVTSKKFSDVISIHLINFCLFVFQIKFILFSL